LRGSAQHVAPAIRPINCALPNNRCEFRFLSSRIWAHNPLPKPFTRVLACNGSAQRQRTLIHGARFKSPARKFVGKSPTEILDFSVNQLGRVSDFRRLPLSRKCTLTISVPFVVFLNTIEQTFYAGLTSQIQKPGDS
jgi:hypothetical protein